MTQTRILAFLIALFASYIAIAHSKTEIGLRFIEEGEKTYVEVHLTSLTLFDLLYDQYPHLESKESLNLGHYLADYQVYFNEHIEVRLNGKRRLLSYVDSNLITHDATIKFWVKDFEEEIEDYEVSVGGFEFYQKPTFAVLITTASITESHFLTRSNNMCVGSSQISMEEDTDSKFVFYVYAFAAFLIACVFIARFAVMRKKELLVENVR